MVLERGHLEIRLKGKTKGRISTLIPPHELMNEKNAANATTTMVPHTRKDLATLNHNIPHRISASCLRNYQFKAPSIFLNVSLTLNKKIEH